MCGRYYVDDDTAREIEKIARQVDDKLRRTVRTGDVYPDQAAGVLRAAGSRVWGEDMHWGFPGFQQRGVIYNARSETALDKKMFRESVLKRRCIIPAKGFYEWDRSKNKAAFSRFDSPVLFMAGFFNQYQGCSRFVILTTKANASVEMIHDRMPLILDRGELENWIFDERSVEFLLHKTPVLLEKALEYEQQKLPGF